jgi:hypothetical protein
MAFSTSTPSTNSQSRSSWASASSTSFSVAVPGGGRNRTHAVQYHRAAPANRRGFQWLRQRPVPMLCATPRANATAGVAIHDGQHFLAERILSCSFYENAFETRLLRAEDDSQVKRLSQSPTDGPACAENIPTSRRTLPLDRCAPFSAALQRQRSTRCRHIAWRAAAYGRLFPAQ